ncbi:hypothetical protein, partial [Streptomyces fildesensis]|uniref:hypothetical protein n=1 Tax=Streptomyces fildesensis TaxID=375757 RepID=UPI001E39CDE5
TTLFRSGIYYNKAEQLQRRDPVKGNIHALQTSHYLNEKKHNGMKQRLLILQEDHLQLQGLQVQLSPHLHPFSAPTAIWKLQPGDWPIGRPRILAPLAEKSDIDDS